MATAPTPRKRRLHRLLGKIEVPQQADQRSKNVATPAGRPHPLARKSVALTLHFSAAFTVLLPSTLAKRSAIGMSNLPLSVRLCIERAEILKALSKAGFELPQRLEKPGNFMKAPYLAIVAALLELDFAICNILLSQTLYSVRDLSAVAGIQSGI